MVAFTEVITGRAPEHRGNGLKYVRQALGQAEARLTFQTGDAILRMRGQTLRMERGRVTMSGCLAIIQY